MDPHREQTPPNSCDQIGGEQPTSGLDELQVVDALDEYIMALKAGRQPDREALLDRFPGLRDELVSYLEAIEFVHEALRELSS
jgi:hypothetical protein